MRFSGLNASIDEPKGHGVARSWLAVTDEKWFQAHKQASHKSAVYWQPTKAGLSLTLGATVYFLVKSSPRCIGGKGTFSESGKETLSNLWGRFGPLLGHDSLSTMLKEMNQKRGSDGALTADSTVAFYAMSDITYFETPIRPEKSFKAGNVKQFWVDVFEGIEFNQSTVRGKYISEKQAAMLNKKATILRAESYSSPINVDPMARARIETAAVRQAIDFYVSKGYQVVSVEKDNCGWDLIANKDAESFKIEVKGLSGDQVRVELTPNEYSQAKMNFQSYRICVVTRAGFPEMFLHEYCRDPRTGRWTDDDGKALKIDEKINALLYLD